MSNIDLDAIRARLDAATPGPWEVDVYAPEGGELIVWGEVEGDMYVDTTSATVADCRLINNAPEDLRALLDIIERIEVLHHPVKVWAVDAANGVWEYDDDGGHIEVGQLCAECTPDGTLELLGDCEWTEDAESVTWPCRTISSLRGESA